MSFILVEVRTDHTDPDEAVRSVSNALKRAGYDVTDYIVGPEAKNIYTNSGDGRVMAQEPEYQSPRVKSKEENILFRKAWDARVEEGQARG